MRRGTLRVAGVRTTGALTGGRGEAAGATAEGSAFTSDGADAAGTRGEGTEAATWGGTAAAAESSVAARAGDRGLAAELGRGPGSADRNPYSSSRAALATPASPAAGNQRRLG